MTAPKPGDEPKTLTPSAVEQVNNVDLFFRGDAHRTPVHRDFYTLALRHAEELDRLRSLSPPEGAALLSHECRNHMACSICGSLPITTKPPEGAEELVKRLRHAVRLEAAGPQWDGTGGAKTKQAIEDAWAELTDFIKRKGAL